MLLAYCDISTKSEGDHTTIPAYTVLSHTLGNLAKQLLSQNDLVKVDTYLRLVDTGLALGQQAVRLGHTITRSNTGRLKNIQLISETSLYFSEHTTVWKHFNLQKYSVLYLYMQQLETGLSDRVGSERWTMLQNILVDALSSYNVIKDSYQLPVHLPQLWSLFVYTLHQHISCENDGIDIAGPSPSCPRLSIEEKAVLLPVAEELLDIYIRKTRYVVVENGYGTAVKQFELSIERLWKLALLSGFTPESIATPTLQQKYLRAVSTDSKLCAEYIQKARKTKKDMKDIWEKVAEYYERSNSDTDLINAYLEQIIEDNYVCSLTGKRFTKAAQALEDGDFTLFGQWEELANMTDQIFGFTGDYMYNTPARYAHLAMIEEKEKVLEQSFLLRK